MLRRQVISSSPETGPSRSYALLRNSPFPLPLLRSRGREDQLKSKLFRLSGQILHDSFFVLPLVGFLPDIHVVFAELQQTIDQQGELVSRGHDSFLRA